MKRESGFIAQFLLFLVVLSVVGFVSYKYFFKSAAVDVLGIYTENIIPTDDTSVSSSIPNTAAGSNTKLYVNSNPHDVTYMKFNLANLAGKSVTSADLYLFVESGKGVNQKIQLVDNISWSEGTLTYANRPSLGTSIANMNVKKFGSYVKFSITEAVKQRAGSSIAIGIENTKRNAFTTISSKENFSKTPYIQVVVDDNVAPPNQNPTAAISATPESGSAPLSVNFSGTGSTDPDGSISGYSWNFGDGTGGQGPTINHIYNTNGTYNATLTVTDNVGASATANKTITVSATPPPPPPPSPVTGYCGDGVRNGTEECDGTDLGGLTCMALGYSSGSLACNSTCSYVMTNCTSPDAAQNVTVDFSRDNGPIAYRATGFIGSFSDTQPPSSVYLPVKPKLHSWNRSWSGINRTMQNGITYQIKLHNLGLIPTTADGDWTKWEALVKQRATEAMNNGYTNVEFDIWNEPEYAQYWSGAIDERYYQMWIRAYRTIKSVNPNFLVAGPSSTSVGWARGAFFTRAKTEGTLPDVLTWHELNDGAGLYNNVMSMRSFYRSNGLPEPQISINEYVSGSFARKPGSIVRFISSIERARIRSASKACWQEGGDWNCQVHMDNILTYPDQKPRSVWWAYKSYADMTGNLSSVYNSANFTGVATKDFETGSGYVLVGNINAVADAKIRLIGLDKTPFYTPGGTINVSIKRIPNTETAALEVPVEISNTRMTPDGTSLDIPLTGVGLYDAYFIVLSK